jgi:hypothetical protein
MYYLEYLLLYIYEAFRDLPNPKVRSGPVESDLGRSPGLELPKVQCFKVPKGTLKPWNWRHVQPWVAPVVRTLVYFQGL